MTKHLDSALQRFYMVHVGLEDYGHAIDGIQAYCRTTGALRALEHHTSTISLHHDRGTTSCRVYIYSRRHAYAR